MLTRVKALTRRFIAAITLSAIAVSAWADVSVSGYYRKDGTYVRPHMRSNPDGNFNNNWSTYGNVNPYTGKRGWIRRPPKGYGGSSSAASGTFSANSPAMSGSDSASSEFSYGDSLPRQREYKQYKRPNYVTNNFTAEQKAEHRDAVAGLQNHGKRLSWKYYTPDRLQNIQDRIEVAMRINEFGINIAWYNRSLDELLNIEKRLVSSTPEDRAKLIAKLQ